MGASLWSEQIRVLETVRDNKRTTVRSANSVGKTHMAAYAALWFLYTYPDSMVITTAPTDRQVKDVLWANIRKAKKASRTSLPGKPLTKKLELDDKWFAIGFTARDPDAFQGWHAENILVIGEEAAGIPQKIFDEGIEALMPPERSKLLLIGNPTDPTGEFRKTFKLPGYSKIKISAFDTPNFTKFGITQEDIEIDTWEAKVTGPLPYPGLVNPRSVADMWNKWGRNKKDPRYTARVLADFPEYSEDTLIKMHWVEAAQRRELNRTNERACGVDVARFGTDETVAYRRWGPVVRLYLQGRGWSTMETAGRVRHGIREGEISNPRIDGVGVGGGVVDALVSEGIDVEDVNVGETSSDPEKFVNQRAEYFWNLRCLFEAGDIDIDPADEELADQLIDMRYQFDSKQRIKIESKKEMKKRGAQSPDRADGVMLTFARPPPEEETATVW